MTSLWKAGRSANFGGSVFGEGRKLAPTTGTVPVENLGRWKA